MQLVDPERFRAHATGLVKDLMGGTVAFPIQTDLFETETGRSLILVGNETLPEKDELAKRASPSQVASVLALNERLDAKRDALRRLADPLAESYKFACPDSRHLPEKDTVRRGAHMLPYPKTYLETHDGHNLLLLVPEIAEEIGITFDHDDHTLPEEYAVVVPFHNASDYPGADAEARYVYTGFCAAFWHEDGQLSSLSGDLGDAIGLTGSEKIVEENMRWAVTTAAQMLTLLNCTNTGTKELRSNIPHNVKNRKDRFKYQVLVVRTNTNHPSHTKGEPLPEDQRRASPRLHFRRGHIRNNADGTQSWVQPCMVGDPEEGTVVKDYEVRPPNE
jgi:hypothetical protein